MTEIASKIQAQGLISYARGMITILDRKGLEKRSCECLQTLLDRPRCCPQSGRAGVPFLLRHSVDSAFGTDLTLAMCNCVIASMNAVAWARSVERN